MRQAWRWLYDKRLIQLESEANLIRERLLQESLAMRRNLELSSLKSDKFAASHQKYVKQLENFHSSLKELSDRLYPPYIQEGLPVALNYLIVQWQEQFPNCQFKLNLPQKWQPQTSASSSIILDLLKDLLRIKKVKFLSNNLIFITLEQNTHGNSTRNQLEVMFSGEKVNDSTLNSDRSQSATFDNCTELEYLQQAFECLTSGSCSNILTENKDIWLFKW